MSGKQTTCGGDTVDRQTSLTGDFTDPVVQVSGDTIQVREMDADQFLVINQSKNSRYVVDDAGCSCPAFEFNDGPCKHMRAVDEVAGDVVDESAEEEKTAEDKKWEQLRSEMRTQTCPFCGEEAVEESMPEPGRWLIYCRCGWHVDQWGDDIEETVPSGHSLSKCTECGQEIVFDEEISEDASWKSGCCEADVEWL